MRAFLDLCRKRQLGPAKLPDGTDIPRPFFRRILLNLNTALQSHEDLFL